MKKKIVAQRFGLISPPLNASPSPATCDNNLITLTSNPDPTDDSFHFHSKAESLTSTGRNNLLTKLDKISESSNSINSNGYRLARPSSSVSNPNINSSFWGGGSKDAYCPNGGGAQNVFSTNSREDNNPLINVDDDDDDSFYDDHNELTGESNLPCLKRDKLKVKILLGY